MRAVGYLGKRGKATVFEHDGAFTVIVNAKAAHDFETFDKADDFAVNQAMGPQFRMGA